MVMLNASEIAAEFQERFEISPRTIRHLAAIGKLPPPDGHDGHGRPLWNQARLDEIAAFLAVDPELRATRHILQHIHNRFETVA